MALLDPCHHLAFDIIGEDAMESFASTVFPKSIGVTDLNLGIDGLILELQDQVNMLPF